jgi:hypothetical protein
MIRLFPPLPDRRAHSLAALLVAVLLARFLYPFIDNPFDHLFSDPMRHWDNAKNLLTPQLYNAIDSRGYQFFLGGLLALVGDNRPLIILVVGLLSAATGYVWYRAAAEILPVRVALVAGILVAASPSLLAIYGYFMNETLLLALMGAAWWITFRAARQESTALFALAVLLWLAAMLTRIIVLPMAGLALLWLWWSLPRRVPHAALAALMAAATLIPAGLYGYDKLRIFAPLGFTGTSVIYAQSHASGFQFTMNDQYWYFASPSYYTQPFAPFHPYQMPHTEPYRFNIDANHGSRDWNAIIQSLKWRATWSDYAQRLKVNVVFFFWGPSWPDSRAALTTDQWVAWLGHWQRWIWAPLVLFVLLASVPARLQGGAMVMAAALLGTTAYLIFQDSGVMEGRYRKPLEPMMIVVAVAVAMGLASRFKARAKNHIAVEGIINPQHGNHGQTLGNQGR